MKTMSTSLLLSAIAMLLAGNAAAQNKQTVQGAQTFLQGLAENGGTAGIYPKYGLIGKAYFEGTPAFLNGWAKAIDDIDENGKVDPCVTRITVLDISQPGAWAQGIRWSAFVEGVALNASLANYPAPRYIHWGKTGITRETYGLKDGSGMTQYVLARYVNPKTRDTEVFGFGALDATLVDRIEYAMKFLQASCDTSVSTGF